MSNFLLRLLVVPTSKDLVVYCYTLMIKLRAHAKPFDPYVVTGIELKCNK